VGGKEAEPLLVLRRRRLFQKDNSWVASGLLDQLVNELRIGGYKHSVLSQQITEKVALIATAQAWMLGHFEDAEADPAELLSDRRRQILVNADGREAGSRLVSHRIEAWASA
jgi:hypothetical protein